MQMIETVARAIGAAAVADACGKFELDWPHLTCDDANGAIDLRIVARAAIQAMREPTDAMKSANDEVYWEGWYAMIDAALGPETNLAAPSDA